MIYKMAYHFDIRIPWETSRGDDAGPRKGKVRGDPGARPVRDDDAERLPICCAVYCRTDVAHGRLGAASKTMQW